MQRKGRVRHRQRHTHSLKEKGIGWDIRYQERKRSLVETSSEDSKGYGVGPRSEKTGEKTVRGYPYIFLSHHFHFLCLERGLELQQCKCL